MQTKARRCRAFVLGLPRPRNKNERDKWIKHIEKLITEVKHQDLKEYGPFRKCGLIPENRNIFEAEQELADLQDYIGIERSSLDFRDLERWVEGYKMAASDGSCQRPEDHRLARAGFGVYYGPEHPYNTRKPLAGTSTQNNIFS